MMNVGDSARNDALVDLKSRQSNHVFDGAGENVRYHSDSESLGPRKSKTRYINPAIYIEPVEASQSVTSLRTDSSSGAEDVTPHPHHASYRSNSTPMLSGRESTTSVGSVKRVSCRLAGTPTAVMLEQERDVELTLQTNLTYRETPYGNETFREVNATFREGHATYHDEHGAYRDGNATYRDEHATYRDGHATYRDADTFRLSVASLSTTTTVKEERERNERKKQEAFKQWLAKKEQEKKEKARLNKMKQQQQNVPTPQQREEAFRQWCERKRAENENKKAEEIMRRYREHERLEQERNQRIRSKEEKLNDWIKKKEEEMKAMKTKEERKAARAQIEEQKRRAAGERAYRDWLRSSKNKPLPVPLNQGELSMRGSVSQMYVNPIPWQSPT